MRAVQLDRFGGPEVLMPREGVPVPVPQKGQMLIRVHATGVNPGDAGVRAGQLWFITGRKFPLTPGLDVAGEIVSGAGFEPGARVLGFGLGAAGAYAQYVVLPEAALAPIPEGVSWAQAAALPIAGMTALQCVDDHAAVKPGAQVLIRGASGGVGHLAVQLARQRGAVVTAVARIEHTEWLRSLGAENVAPPETLMQLGRFDAVIDLKGGLSWRQLGALCREGGRAVTSVPSFPNLFFGWAAPLFGVRLRSMIVAPRRAQLTRLIEQVADGSLQVHVEATHPLDAAAEVHRRLAQGGVRGKLVLLVNHASNGGLS